MMNLQYLSYKKRLRARKRREEIGDSHSSSGTVEYDFKDMGAHEEDAMPENDVEDKFHSSSETIEYEYEDQHKQTDVEMNSADEMSVNHVCKGENKELTNKPVEDNDKDKEHLSGQKFNEWAMFYKYMKQHNNCN